MKILLEIKAECESAMQAYPAFHSYHEGYAVLLEEVDELWDQVKLKPKLQDKAKMRLECIQIAAMALRFAIELCENNPKV